MLLVNAVIAYTTWGVIGIACVSKNNDTSQLPSSIKECDVFYQ